MTRAPDRRSLHLYHDLDGCPDRDLALEEEFLDQVSAGVVSLFLYSWQFPVVVLGYGQKVEDVEMDWCRAAGVPVYRRMTGGTGVVHRRDLAVSLFLPSEHRWAQRITGLYELFLGTLAPALEAAGGQTRQADSTARGGRDRSPICFEDQLSDTLVVEGRKVVGCAQARRSRSVLIHAAISLNLATETYAGAFGVSERRIRKGLGEAVPGGRPGEVAPHVETALAKALEMRVRHEPLPDPKGLERRNRVEDLSKAR